MKVWVYQPAECSDFFKCSIRGKLTLPLIQRARGLILYILCGNDMKRTAAALFLLLACRAAYAAKGGNAMRELPISICRTSF